MERVRERHPVRVLSLLKMHDFPHRLRFGEAADADFDTLGAGTGMFETICTDADWCPRGVLEATLELAIEIAREGREGRRIGTLFTLGRAGAVLQCSRPLILDPIALHPREPVISTRANP